MSRIVKPTTTTEYKLKKELAYSIISISRDLINNPLESYITLSSNNSKLVLQEALKTLRSLKHQKCEGNV